jgi:hypothetical protein
MPLDIEHIYPEALGGPTERENRWLACTRCNDFKGDRTSADADGGDSVPLFNPRTGIWTAHFAWSGDGTRILGLTAVGRAMVEALRLNNEFIMIARQFWVEADRWPPSEDMR